MDFYIKSLESEQQIEGHTELYFVVYVDKSEG